ncbi:TVP38/TMEM64 family protein [Lutibaculum baratangense]|uniref:Putative membrane protein n=1 Tax=Lutibaculum baratangense AMV1 TaxID=631454 RepID=V4RVA7_9HYPH|nr:VTT domain-containing protein [Lutibaculum baratangense]ESR26975.1 putative membrane protein [Lutibaculum baratangense AMV1]
MALSLPGGLVLTVAEGLFFGWLTGGLVTLVAATLGASLLFLVARTTLGETLAERAGPRLEALRAGFTEDAASYLLFLRLVPVFPFWLVNPAPALLGLGRLRRHDLRRERPGHLRLLRDRGGPRQRGGRAGRGAGGLPCGRGR